MSTIRMDAEILAQHLENVANLYDEDAVRAREAGQPRLRQQFEKQASQCREWAAGLRNVRAIGFGDGDLIELEQFETY